MLIGELQDAAIDSLLEAIGPRSGSRLLSVELRHCGGALSRAMQAAGALATLPGSFLAFGVGFVPVPDAMAPTRAWLGAFKSSLEPYDSGRNFNFAEERLEMTQAFPRETVGRLREVKQRYDSDDLFRSNHPVTGKECAALGRDTFAVAELLVHDPEHFVQTAVGGWVREAGSGTATVSGDS